MEQYTRVSYQLAQTVTLDYSTSFGQSSKLFSPEIRTHIYAIYGLVRVADEVVDTYNGKDTARLIKELESHTLHALKIGFSPNPLVHAFVTTAKRYGIGRDLVRPFFKSMHMDLKQKRYTPHAYATYIYGSAEVIGLMCLKIFCDDVAQYKHLEPKARALGSAYQKVNFLRDIRADYEERGRVYFPDVTFESFTDRRKNALIKDIKKDFQKAKPAIAELPPQARKAVALSYAYYNELLVKLEKASAEDIKTARIRISTAKKMQLYFAVRTSRGRV